MEQHSLIDPILSLSFSVHANPGVYALLLGSGVSRGAGIPTGWEIVSDVIQQLAAMVGEEEECAENPGRWYFDHTGRYPNYSEILEQLLLTPTQRQQKLKTYIEPTEEDREDELKLPTAAHQAIAELVAKGYIKVIITTNFDRLLETALADVGIVPNVLSSIHQIRGALPLVHTQCCILKVHGDYLDPVTLNTLEELQEYSDEFNEFLDRVFDEFGLVVCGWSADWDIALGHALLRARSKRFSTYWATRGEPGDSARRLIDHREARVTSIVDADSFFDDVKEHVHSIEEFSKPHPLSTEVAVSSLKRYLPNPADNIRLADLIGKTVERIIDEKSKICGDAFSSEVNTESVTARVRAYESACSTLMAMAVVGGRWAEADHYGIWQQALNRLSEAPVSNGLSHWLNLQRYTGTLLLYSLGMGAIESDRLPLLGNLFSTEIYRQLQESTKAVQLITAGRLLETGYQTMQILDGLDRRHVPLSDWIHDTLREYAVDVIPSDQRYTLMFDRLEIQMALSFAHHEDSIESGERPWLLPGAFVYRSRNREQILQEIKGSLDTFQDSSPFVNARIFGDSAEECVQNIEVFRAFVQRLGRMLR